MKREVTVSHISCKDHHVITIENHNLHGSNPLGFNKRVHLFFPPSEMVGVSGMQRDYEMP